MEPNLLGSRTVYKSTGRVDWSRFVLWAGLVFAASAAMAVILFLLFRAGCYYVILVPALAALAVGALVRLAVAKGHCRNRLVATLTGFVSGVILYFGYYYVGMVHDFGPETATQFQLLPTYIRLRLATDVVRDVGDSDTDENRHRHRSGGFNWVHFSIETVLVLGITSVAGYNRARKTYCERCRRWMARELTYFDPGKTPDLLGALENGSARSLAGVFATPVFATLPNTTVAVDYCPTLKETMSRDCPVFISVKSVTANPGGARFDPFETSKGKVLARAVQLNGDALPALALRFPFFETITGRSAVTALVPREEVSPEAEAKQTGEYADVRPVEAEHAGKALSRKTALIGNAFALAPLLAVFAAIGLAAWGGMTAFPDSHTATAPEKTLGLVALVVGATLLVVVLGFILVNPSYLGNRYLLKLLKREIAGRTACLVDPGDPEALFVEIVPKLNWGKLALDDAQDVGFLLLDRGRRQILFEGDKERFRIPAGAITYCEVEYFVQGKGTHAATKVYYVVLRAAHPTRFWEAPIRERTGRGLFRTGRRKKSAHKLFNAIQEIRA